MAPRKIPAFDTSGKDFLLRKDVPENKSMNGSASKPQMKEEQTSGSAPLLPKLRKSVQSRKRRFMKPLEEIKILDLSHASLQPPPTSPVVEQELAPRIHRV
uniref:Uncharacterized protein n=1 Tax=Bionectria ochroleuca TaxID=29856 RepID=A0A8H7K8Z3_BIOOC